jgi:hypothetical protein
MATITSKFVTSNSELHFSSSAFADAAAFTASTKVSLVAEIGSISNEANVIDVPEFGATYKGKLRGQLDAGQLDSVLYWAPRDAMHKSIQDAATDGSIVYVGIKWSDNAGSDAEYVTFKGFVSSFGIDTSFDDVAKANTTFVIDGALTFFAGV